MKFNMAVSMRRHKLVSLLGCLVLAPTLAFAQSAEPTPPDVSPPAVSPPAVSPPIVGEENATGVPPLKVVGKDMPPMTPTSAEQVVAAVRQSIATVTYMGRDGKPAGTGSGFVVSEEGLIATNLHVIGEARPVVVQLNDGRSYEATEVFASDRRLDLAVVRIAVRGLTPLPLGDSSTLRQGQPVVALGNPRGLRNSVVVGVVSGRQQIEGREMIQLAIPIERGNSGGPLLDLDGRVHGLLTMKSAVTENLGFAIASNDLKSLLDKPNTIPMTRWLTIGALDPRDWNVVSGGRWRQRAGVLISEGSGGGFGGRTLCLSKVAVPGPPFEIAVSVKLDDETGAAGLAFCSDGGDRHYGFYATGTRLRFTRFDGPDVFAWTVIREQASSAYKPGEWNTLKVRFEPGKIIGSVNGETVIESNDDDFSSGSVGLVKFRDPTASFRQFRIGVSLPSDQPSAESVASLRAALNEPRSENETSVTEAAAEYLQGKDPAASVILKSEADLLVTRAAELRVLAELMTEQATRRALVAELQKPEAEIDLFAAALHVSKLDNPLLDVDVYRRQLDRIADELKTMLPNEPDDAARLGALNRLLFEEMGFHGSRSDYNDRSNSYVNEVLDDREGIPVTLSVLYIELGRRIGLNLEGVSFPGHFLVRHLPADGEPQIIDVFEGGKPVSRDGLLELARFQSVEQLTDDMLAAATRKGIVLRMLRNLIGRARDERSGPALLRYTNTVLAIDPESPVDRLQRALLLMQLGRKAEARNDTSWLLEKRPAEMDMERVSELDQMLRRP